MNSVVKRSSNTITLSFSFAVEAPRFC